MEYQQQSAQALFCAILRCGTLRCACVSAITPSPCYAVPQAPGPGGGYTSGRATDGGTDGGCARDTAEPKPPRHPNFRIPMHTPHFSIRIPHT